MLYWLVQESVVEEHSHGKGAPAQRGAMCARIASKLFRQRHERLVKDLAAFM